MELTLTPLLVIVKVTMTMRTKIIDCLLCAIMCCILYFAMYNAHIFAKIFEGKIRIHIVHE